MGGRNLEDPCHGKDRYGTQEHAERRAANASERFGIALRAYECEFCGCWHLTKQRPRKDQVKP